MKKLLLLLAAIIIVLSYYLFKKETEINPVSSFTPVLTPSTNSLQASSSPSPEIQNSNSKTFIFENFHGEKVDGGGFKFDYPKSWYNNGQYFSPQRVKFYDLLSVNAPMYFDLVSTEIFDQTELKYTIEHSKRYAKDSAAVIDNQNFKKYDLIDNDSYGGSGAGRVIIYFGPDINLFGEKYVLIFHWEEKPLTASMEGNDPEIFNKIVSTLKFIK